MNFESAQAMASQFASSALTWVSSQAFYSQLGLVLVAALLAYLLADLLKRQTSIFREPTDTGSLHVIRYGIYRLRDVLFLIFLVLFLAIAIDLSLSWVQDAGLARFSECVALVLLIYALVSRFVGNHFLRNLIKWIAIPIALLRVFGWLDDVIVYLESLYIELGNIKVSVYGVIRVLIFGVIFFWLGRASNRIGQRVIRQQEHLDVGTREVFAKLYQVILMLVIFLLLLQVMGINITALAVFGGALGVGLGFGLQSIASNFISGLIILLDRSLSVGDHIELEDGRTGIIRELNMRSTTVETFDGKDIMVPNERFITTSFVNWTHKNIRQRYALEFQVAYSTDMHALFKLLREVVASHPKVLSGPDYLYEEQPDAEICGFGESGVDILVEFWMEGIDDGVNRVGGDLYLMIWDAFKANGIHFPFPQREVKILNK